MGGVVAALLLDQFPRNMFRDTARAFATDAKARDVSRHVITSGFDRKLSLIMRRFFYLPLKHSEHLHDQIESARLALVLTDEYGESGEDRDSEVRRVASTDNSAIRLVSRPKRGARAAIDEKGDRIRQAPALTKLACCGFSRRAVDGKAP